MPNSEANMRNGRARHMVERDVAHAPVMPLAVTLRSSVFLSRDRLRLPRPPLSLLRLRRLSLRGRRIWTGGQGTRRRGCAHTGGENGGGQLF